MSNTGYRSVEINVINDTRGDLIVQGPQTAANSTWIQGEEAKQGDEIQQYNSVKWGVMTNDINGIAQGSVQLTGIGAFPVRITFTNTVSGQSTCVVSPNDAVTGLVTPIQTGEVNHSAFQVQLIPLS